MSQIGQANQRQQQQFRDYAHLLANPPSGGYNAARSGPLAQLAEQVTFNHLVRGSSPLWPIYP